MTKSLSRDSLSRYLYALLENLIEVLVVLKLCLIRVFANTLFYLNAFYCKTPLERKNAFAGCSALLLHQKFF